MRIRMWFLAAIVAIGAGCPGTLVVTLDDSHKLPAVPVASAEAVKLIACRARACAEGTYPPPTAFVGTETAERQSLVVETFKVFKIQTDCTTATSADYLQANGGTPGSAKSLWLTGCFYSQCLAGKAPFGAPLPAAAASAWGGLVSDSLVALHINTDCGDVKP